MDCVWCALVRLLAFCVPFVDYFIVSAFTRSIHSIFLNDVVVCRSSSVVCLRSLSLKYNADNPDATVATVAFMNSQKHSRTMRPTKHYYRTLSKPKNDCICLVKINGSHASRTMTHTQIVFDADDAVVPDMNHFVLFAHAQTMH